MGRSERRKGADGEREVAGVIRHVAGIACDRVPNSGGLWIPGDVAGVDGFHIEVKRQETLRLPLWLRQAADDAPAGSVPVVVFRQSLTPWQATLPLHAFAQLLRIRDMSLVARTDARGDDGEA